MPESEEFFRELTKNLTPRPLHEIVNLSSSISKWYAELLATQSPLASLQDGITVGTAMVPASEQLFNKKLDGPVPQNSPQTPPIANSSDADCSPIKSETRRPLAGPNAPPAERAHSVLKRRNKKPAIPSAKRMTHEDHAISLLLKHPDLLQKEIAEQLGIHPGQVSRMLRLKVLLDARKHRHPLNGRIRRGSKDSRTGEIIAFDEPDE